MCIYMYLFIFVLAFLYFYMLTNQIATDWLKTCIFNGCIYLYLKGKFSFQGQKAETERGVINPFVQ